MKEIFDVGLLKEAASLAHDPAQPTEAVTLQYLTNGTTKLTLGQLNLAALPMAQADG